MSAKDRGRDRERKSQSKKENESERERERATMEIMSNNGYNVKKAVQKLLCKVNSKVCC